jgi:hypothetical protein
VIYFCLLKSQVVDFIVKLIHANSLLEESHRAGSIIVYDLLRFEVVAESEVVLLSRIEVPSPFLSLVDGFTVLLKSFVI